MQKHYNPQEIEQKWQRRWEEAKVYEVDLKAAERPYFTHVMFPYPSGDKLHVGHWYNFAPADSYARFKKMRGFDVFSPMGFDAFGLPAENYAIKTGVPPQRSITENVETMTKQLHRIGCMYDWKQSVNTSTPEYYCFTQWIFLQMYKNGLAYRKEGAVNFCPSCQTVLANEQVWEGKCERCDSDVVQKPLTQWYWKITQYAQRLLDGLNKLDWPEKTKTMQRHWIGRSEGCDVRWKVEGQNITLDTFTTTVDTIYGVTFVVISPEHPMLPELVTKEKGKEVATYCNEARKKTERERMMAVQEKTGVPTGTNVLHPFTGKPVPLWIADYVLMSYGTGVVMGVPAHDQRDMDFARKYHLPIIQSIQSEDRKSFVYDDVDKDNVKGTIIESGEFTHMPILEGRRKIIEELERKGLGKAKIQFRIRDWLVSRQRYWGAPIPIVYDPEGNPHPVPEKNLPWMLPTDVEFKPTGKSPLTYSKEFIERTEKIFGKGWRPECDTMDTFVDSSFYSLMYLSTSGFGVKCQKSIVNCPLIDRAVEQRWMPVQMYIGGAEHACMHLIYARFVQMALHDFGFVATEEPYQRLVHQGVITNKGAKMSKSKGNVVSPDSFVEREGSDVFRMYLMFMGPFTEGGDWSDTGIKGISRFASRVHTFFTNPNNIRHATPARHAEHVMVSLSNHEARLLHQTIKKVTEDIEKLHFNTAISSLMIFLNAAEEAGSVTLETAIVFAKLLAPLAPHLAEELWEALQKNVIPGSLDASIHPAMSSRVIQHGYEVLDRIEGATRLDTRHDTEGSAPRSSDRSKVGFVIESDWPTFDPAKIVEESVTIAIQVNGKVRGEIEIAADASEADVLNKAKEQENVKRYLEGKRLKRELYVKGKLVSFVA